MHFIPGALNLDGASLEENSAAAEGEAKITQKPQEAGRGLNGNLRQQLLDLTEVVVLIELVEIKKKTQNLK